MILSLLAIDFSLQISQLSYLCSQRLKLYALRKKGILIVFLRTQYIFQHPYQLIYVLNVGFVFYINQMGMNQQNQEA